LLGTPRISAVSSSASIEIQETRADTTPAATTPAPTTQYPNLAPFDASQLYARQGRWYGIQTLAMDGLAVLDSAIGFGTFVGENDSQTSAAPGIAIMSVGIAFAGFGTPILHFLHGNLLAGFVSMGLRVAILGIGLGLAVAAPDDNGNANPIAILGSILAMSVPIVLDSALWSYDSHVGAHATHAAADHFSLSPWISPTPHGGAIGLSGAF
jgi:hypothetical protein